MRWMSFKLLKTVEIFKNADGILSKLNIYEIKNI